MNLLGVVIIFCEKSRHEFKRRVKTQELSRNVTCLLHFHCILSSSLKYNGKANTDPVGQNLIQFFPLSSNQDLPFQFVKSV